MASTTSASFHDLADRLGLADDIALLKSGIVEWIEDSSSEIVAIFSCHRAVKDGPMSARTLRSAVALELFHNVSLIVDDILDRSRLRRGRLTLHCRFGALPALMTAGYLTAGGFKMVAGDSYSAQLLARLMQRLSVAECLQWRLRRQPLGVSDWRRIAAIEECS